MRYKIVSPMTASVYSILYFEGEEVKKDDELLTLESMKVLHDILSPCHGTINMVRVQEGEIVDQGSVLMEIESLER